jgi:uncharacterized protein YxjI
MTHVAGGQRVIGKEKLLATARTFTVPDETGTPAFEVDGTPFLMHQSFAIKNANRDELYRLKQNVLAFTMTMLILTGERQVVEVVRELAVPTESKFTIHRDGGEPLVAEGDVLGYRSSIARDGATVATVSRDGVNLLNTYPVEITPGEDAAFAIACSVAMDRMIAEVKPGPGHLPTL